MKKILITGAGSYIGTSVEKWLLKEPNQYQVDVLDMKQSAWKEYDFTNYDVVFHVAGLAHADVENINDKQKELYYKINTNLAIEVAKKAKKLGVKQFIFMSSMIVYSGCNTNYITKKTIPQPQNFYGDSKWKADQIVRTLDSDDFKVVVLRPPMIYGQGSKGNYPQLVKIATKLSIFPKVSNKRSMLYIDNLCEFVKVMIDNEEKGIFFPQNDEYSNISKMVKLIADANNHKIILIPGLNWFVSIIKYVPGKIGKLATKAFGDFWYDMNMSDYKKNYRVNGWEESIIITENKKV